MKNKLPAGFANIFLALNASLILCDIKIVLELVKGGIFYFGQVLPGFDILIFLEVIFRLEHINKEQKGTQGGNNETLNRSIEQLVS